jgi:outer membrane receptor protein involved in Fe transport
LRSYEAGIKAETDNGTFGVDLAGYYIDWSNIQVQASRNGFSVIANAGSATVQGSELTLTARPISGFTATGALAYQEAHLSEADQDLGAAKGERLPNVPRFTAALNADYTLRDTGVRPSIGATMRHVSERMVSFDSSAGLPQYRLPPYATIDLRSGITLSAVTVQLYMRNVFDKRGQLSALTNLGPVQVSILQPRTVGMSVTTPF